MTSLVEETAERLTQVRAYRWTSESVFRWLKQVLQLDTVSSVRPAGLEMQGAVALLMDGLLLLYHAGGSLSLKALQRQLKPALNEASFAAGVAEGERRARARAAACGPSPPRLRVVA